VCVAVVGPPLAAGAAARSRSPSECSGSGGAGGAAGAGSGGDPASLAPLAPLLSAAVLLGDADDSSSVGASSSPRSSIASCSATPLSAGETVLAPGSAPGSGSSSAAGAEPRAAYERTPPSLLSSLCISAAADGLM
jgi:hypothetical protein